VVIVACGTSYHAGMVGKYYFEELADLPTEVDQAAEYRYRNPIIRPDDMVVALQLFSYHVARLRKCAIDQPRNLAKSVTVE